MKSGTTRGLIIFGAVVLVILVAGIIIYMTLGRPTEISMDVLQQKVAAANEVEKVNITNDKIDVKYRGSDKDYDVFLYGRSYVESWLFEYNQTVLSNAPEKETDGEEGISDAEQTAYDAWFAANRIEVVVNDRNAVSVLSILYPIGGLILIVVIAVFLFRSINGQNKQTMNFGRTKAASQGNVKVRFADVAGAEEEKVELQEVVEFLKNPQKFTKVGAKIPRGVLLVGPPGTGKTLFAKAVAGEASVPFFSISGSDFVEMFVGVGASRVRDLFDQAKKNMPCIVFIDEIDAVGRQRGAGLGGGHDEREQTLNQLLVQMDGFETNEGIIVMAATNRADILDPALLRPGRFDRQIYVNIPDVRGREAIFKVHARNKPVLPSVDFQALARSTHGFTGADIANVLNEAAIICARDNRTEISMEDINNGITKAMLGVQKKSRVVTETDKRIVAYHEAGHAIVAKCCKFGGSVHEVSIIPRGGGAGGYTWYRPENDNGMHPSQYYREDIASTMGGRAAEEIFIQDISAGASADIKSATQTAQRMVTEWGMSGNKKLGQVFYGSSQEVFLGRDYQSTHNYSEMTAAEIDKEVSRLVEEGYANERA